MVTSSTAARNDASFAFDGLLNPVILRTNWRAADRSSSSVAGGWKLNKILIFLHINELPEPAEGGPTQSFRLAAGLAPAFAPGLRDYSTSHAIILYSQSLRALEDCIDKRFIRINDRIRAREIRVIDDEGGQLGIMPPYEAIKKACEKNLDLVEISPTAQPPVCRIMDYGKYLYQQEKKEREAKKHQKTITVKEVKFRINVDDHDYETKKN